MASCLSGASTFAYSRRKRVRLSYHPGQTFGAQLSDNQRGRLAVVAVQEGSRAAQEGIKECSVLDEVNGHSVRTMTPSAVADLLQGLSGPRNLVFTVVGRE